MRRLLLVGTCAFAIACGNNGGNPFAATAPARPPAADAAILFVSGSWSAQPDAPREIMAIAADGSNPQQLTTCARAAQPCDILQVAPSPDRVRVVAVRTTPDAEAGAQVLYFMDLSRSVETHPAPAPSRRLGRLVEGRQLPAVRLAQRPGRQRGPVHRAAGRDPGAEPHRLAERARATRTARSLRPHRGLRADRRHGVSRIYLFRESPVTSGPAAGPALPGTPYVVGADADPAFSPDGTLIVFRRLTGTATAGSGPGT